MIDLSSLKGKRVVVTGTGFLGGHVLDALERAGAETAVPCRDKPFPEKVDLTDTASCRTMFENVADWFRPDAVIHIAGRNGK